MHPALQPGNKSNTTTLVSALYDINRHDRPFQEYKPWAEATFQIALPMVLFTNAANLPWIRAARGDLPTFFITEEDIPLEHLSDTVHAILSELKNSNGAVEWRNKRYIPLQFSKAVWLQRAIALNPFDSDIFFWVDAGLSRFFQNNQPHAPFPLLESSNLMQHKMYLTATESFNELASKTPGEIIGSQRNYFMGTVFGGHIEAVKRVCVALLNVLTLDMLQQGLLDNEQIGLSVVFLRHKDWFEPLDATSLRCKVVCK